jgi:hypothetical protein
MEHINVIVRTRHAKESMQNLLVLRCHFFKYDGGLFGVTLVLPTQTFEEFFFPLPVHAIN